MTPQVQNIAISSCLSPAGFGHKSSRRAQRHPSLMITMPRGQPAAASQGVGGCALGGPCTGLPGDAEPDQIAACACVLCVTVRRIFEEDRWRLMRGQAGGGIFGWPCWVVHVGGWVCAWCETACGFLGARAGWIDVGVVRRYPARRDLGVRALVGGRMG
jgi:hypothetical protein